MKRILLILLTSTLAVNAQSSNYRNIVRQIQQPNGVVWDMPDVLPNGAAPSALNIEAGGALFQLWTIEKATAKDYLLDQKLVGAYLPTADLKVTTEDPYTGVPRTRIGRPFTVDVNIPGLLSGAGLPLAATKVLYEKHIQNYATPRVSLSPTAVLSNTPTSSSYYTANGKTTLRYESSALTASDPTKASGEEHFVVHALTDGATSQTQIASALVQVWPVASGLIKGISPGDKIRFQAPKIELILTDLYPRSNTYLLLFKGNQTTTGGITVKEYPWDSEEPCSIVISVSELESKLTQDGDYTLALVSDTIFGRELLGVVIPFSVDRTLKVNAMQMTFSDGQAP
ncbi:MAG: hypothetical protein H8M99_15475 [Gloeobacteraceae cyanobacterium ES-bin-144]|nr:hypothetical protein [Verrucomicrobiales bacterium]